MCFWWVLSKYIYYGILILTKILVWQCKYKKNNRYHPCISRQKTCAWICLKYSPFRPQSIQPSGFLAETALSHCLPSLPAGFRQQAARRPVLLLLCRVETCETRNYANQPVSGEARVAGSNSGGDGNAPFFMR